MIIPIDSAKLIEVMQLLNHPSLDDSDEVNTAYNILDSLLYRDNEKLTDTKSLLDEIQSIISYESATWPLHCSLSSAQINKINEIVKEINRQERTIMTDISPTDEEVKQND